MKRDGPENQPTRGKTAPNRLRRLDAFVALHAPELLSPHGPLADALFVDLGFGRLPLTTLQSLEIWRRHHPGLRGLGVELDPERVAAAQAYAQPGLSFRRGGFALPLRARERVGILRAMNVLRQYPLDEVLAAQAHMVSQLAPGGLLLEGTSDPFGRVMVVNVLRRGADGPELEAVLFATNLRWGSHPELFPPVLPRQLIARNVPGEPVHALFEAWTQAWTRAVHASVFGERQRFEAAAIGLSEIHPGIDARRRWRQRGMVLWRRPPYP
ncbi:MAG: hypothetical protein H6741_08365 [Alphaproteobacteria bacterium]|nr:hypothetical protein [Alphaproteobacteria bacterium]MCB9792730.1 hypothetical protein [Alphaproteobacteria bacterium]